MEQHDGSTSMDDQPKLETMSARPCERTFLFDDIAIRSDGEGRTVVAYCAAFDRPAEIQDQDGHYIETINRTAFDKTVSGRLNQIQVFYNHGKTLYGTPSERFSMPLGVPVEIKPDNVGVLTATRYNRNPLADEVLESVRNGDIRGQSFSGRFLPGRSQRTRGRNGELDTIVRSEVVLKEYGPTPLPAYAEAAILGVRTDEMRATLITLTIEDQIEFIQDTLAGLPDEHRAELTRMLMLDTSRAIGTPSPAADAAPENTEGTSVTTDPPDTVHRSNDQAERRARVLELLRSDI